VPTRANLWQNQFIFDIDIDIEVNINIANDKIVIP
jgi:hypothetical protein